MAVIGRHKPLPRLIGTISAAIILACLTATQASASLPGQNGRILFESTAPDPERLTGGIGTPDSGRSLFTAKANGNDMRVLLSHAADASWAPDGTRFVFISRTPGVLGLIDPAMPSGGTSLETGLRSASAPAWAPDGARIAFVGYDSSFRSDIYVLEVATGTVSNVTRDEALDLAPSWSPDAARIAFASVRGGATNMDIFTMAPDGTRMVNLTNSDVNEFDPDWSPGGSQIAFAAGGANIDLWKMQADGTGRTRVTTQPGNEVNPVWSPAGDFFLFQVDRTGSGDIYKARVDGSEAVNITSSSHDDRHPDWNSQVPVPILTVNTTDDLDDGFCTSSHCSLREAIGESNRRPGKDMIDFEILPSGLQTIKPLSALPPLSEPVVVDGRTQFGYTTHPLIEVDGSLAGARTDGLVVAGGNSVVQGLAINRFSGSGLVIQGNGASTIYENHLGVDPMGSQSRGNAGAGLAVLDSEENFVGRRPGPNLGWVPRPPRNTISTTSGPGIVIRGAQSTGNVIDQNDIGVQAGAGAALEPVTPNPGIVVDGGAASNDIRFNLVTGNGDAIVVDGPTTMDNHIQSNHIGRLDEHYSVPGTGGWGVIVRDAPATHIVGNGISQPAIGGIHVFGASATFAEVQGNGVHMDPGSSMAGPAAIWIDGTSNVRLAGNSAGGGRVGILIDADDNDLEGNSAGASQGAGIELRGSRNLLHPVEIEPSTYTPWDRIVENGGPGVAVISGSGNRIMSGSLRDNAGLGIDLAADGVTPNDPGDVDSGPNGLQNFPSLTTAVRNRGDVTVSGVLHSKADSEYTINVTVVERCDPTGHGEADRLLPLREFPVMTDSTGTARFTQRIGRADYVSLPMLDELLTATATDSAGSTSELGPCVGVTPGVEDRTISVNAADDLDDGFCTVQHCSLREAIKASNAGAGFDRIAFDLPSQSETVSPRSSLPQLTDPAIIDGTSQPGYAGKPIIELDGSGAGNGANGITLAAPSSTVKGLVVHSFKGHGIETRAYGAEARIVGNFIGTDRSGTQDAGNGGAGISLHDYGHVDDRYWILAEPHVIGGSAPADRNVIGGNGEAGLFMFIGTFARVKGNYIGTDASGTKDLGNSGSGIVTQASNGRIGGLETGAGNVISGNGRHGVEILSYRIGYSSGGNDLRGNMIGTDAEGLHAIANAQNGIHNTETTDNTFRGNVISGNRESGIVGNGDRVVGNLVGTDRSGRSPLGNGAWGVMIVGGWLGTATQGDGNIISGNSAGGALISLGGEVVGNWIGTDRERTLNLGNGGPGIRRTSPYGCAYYGWQMKVVANTIFHNDGPGISEAVRCLPATNDISGNRIYANDGLGIDLGDDGVTLNDPFDGDRGINRLQNFPVITAIATAGGRTRIEGRLDSEPGMTYTIELFSSEVCDPLGHGEGQIPVGSFQVQANSAGSVVFARELSQSLPFARSVTATAIGQEDLRYRLDRFTSEFSPCARATADLSVVIADSPDPVKVGKELRYSVTVRNGGPSEARDVVLEVALPRHGGWGTQTTSRGSCGRVNGSVRCSLGTLAPGESANVTILIKPTSRGTGTATARVSAPEPADPHSGNNSATTTTVIGP